MSKKFRLSQLELTSDTSNRSGLVTKNLTSATADKVVWTTFKNVLVDENGEIVVGAWLSTPTSTSVTGNTNGDVTSMSFRWENDTGALNTATSGVMQKVFRQQTVASWLLTDTVIVEEYVDNTLYVDLAYGNNTTGLRERADRPFATVAAAVTASSPWDTIVLRNGSYAFWALILPHSLNFQAESWANRASWELWVPAWATVSYNWWTLYRSSGNSNLFVPRWDNVTITWYVEEWSADWISLYNLGSTTAYTWLNLTFSVWTMKATWTTWVQFYLSRNASSTILTNCIIRYRGKYMERNVWFRCWDSIDTLIDIECDEYNGAWVWTNMWMWRRPRNVSTRNGLIYKWDKYYSNNVTQPCFSILAESYNFDMFINIKDVNTPTTFLQAWAAINANIYCDWDSWTHTWVYDMIDLQQSLVNPSLSTVPLKLYFNVVFAENNNNVSKPSIAWYWTDRALIWLTWWTNAVITSKVLRSLKNEVIWIDHASPQTIEDQVTWLVEIFWTRIEKLWRDVWAWYDWVIIVDQWSASAPAVNLPNSVIRFYNWASIYNLWDAYAVKQIAVNPTWAEAELEYYDNIVTNNLTNSNILKETYVYAPTKTITAWDLVAWVYTVKDNENDLYADIATLWSFTLAIWDPAKFINRELSIKATSTHPTNTITIDPAWGALIDWALTYVVPNTSTGMTNIVTKSDWTARRIK